MTESEYAAKLNQLQVENSNLRRTIGRQAAEIVELKDAAEIRRWIDVDILTHGTAKADNNRP